MTGDEVRRKYGIPKKVLDEYRKMGLCDAVRLSFSDWRYDDTDLERLGTIMALHDMGLSHEQVEAYMKLLIKGEIADAERLRMLDDMRASTLDQIHLKERQLQRMDYLRQKIREAGRADDGSGKTK